jgi:hypothetical protein
MTMMKWRKRRTVTTLRPSSAPPFFPLTTFRLLIAVLCLIVLQASATSAAPAGQKPDQPYALIFGTVWGPDDHPLYGVKVKIRRADQKKAHWELYSDHNGEFAQRLPVGPGDYLVSADLKGFKWSNGKELHQDGEVKVHVDKDERQDVGLHLKQ